MPCEFRLRTWLPAMPAYTEWISQPAMSSASSTARWIDCTVDSMLTTTPFLRPRDGCEPMPITSIASSGAYLADQRDHLRGADVEADDQLRSSRLPMSRMLLITLSLLAWSGADAAARDARRPPRAPADREPFV